MLEGEIKEIESLGQNQIFKPQYLKKTDCFSL